MNPIDFAKKLVLAKDKQEGIATRPLPDVTRFGKRNDRLVPELQHEICVKILEGTHPGDAAVACGLSREAYTSWMRQGAEDPDSKYGLFRRAVKQAQAESGARVTAAVTTNAMTDGIVGLKFLAQRFPKRWNKQPVKKLEYSGALQLNAQVVLEEASTSELRAYVVEREAEIAARNSRLIEGTARLLTDGEAAAEEVEDDEP